MTGVFITGTDTNIGKTAVSAALFHRYRQTSSLCYWKPIQTGFPEDDDTATVRTLALCSEDEIHADGIRLARPLSPHLSAQYCGKEIDMASLLSLNKSEKNTRAWIVEGAGGVLVPINAHQFMTDLISALNLPAVIVAGSQLGTINHTLLTLSALRSCSIPIAGVVLTGEPSADNRRSIEVYGKVPVLGEMPRFSTPIAESLARWACTQLDPDGVLGSALSNPREPLWAHT
jgi:dethiobiotin synthase